MDALWNVFQMPALRGAAQIAALLLARLLPVIALTPVFGGQSMPRRLRMGVALAFTLAMLPSFMPLFDRTIPTMDYAVLLAKEVVIGLMLALFVQIMFESIAAVGALIDLARGATLANVFDPLTQNQQSILGAFFTQFAIVLFVSIGGMQLLFRTLADSFVLLPPLAFLPAREFGPDGTGTPIGLVSSMFLLALRLGAPAVVVLLLTDFALGVVNRVAPQIQVFFLGMTAKGTIGLIVVLLGMGLFTDLTVTHFATLFGAMRDWAGAMRT